MTDKQGTRCPAIKPTKKKDEKLLPMHEEFCLEYFDNGFNGKRAYMKANPGCSEKSAEASASRLLRKDKVQKYLKQLREGLRKDKVLSIEGRREWLSGVITDEVKEKATKYIDNEEVEIERSASLYTKQRSLEILNKMDGVGTDNVNVNVNGTIDLDVKDKETLAREYMDRLLKEENK